MDFNSNRSIYLQIYDTVCDRIMAGELAAEERIPSVRDYGADIGVNPNTVMRAYEKLTADGIIYNKRGIGYFICQGAKEKVIQTQKKEFLEKELPEILRRMDLLGITLEECLRIRATV